MIAAVLLVVDDPLERLDELRVALRPDHLGPALADLTGVLAPATGERPTPLGVADPSGPPVVGIGYERDVAEAFQVTQQVVGRLLAHLMAHGHVGRAQPVQRRELLERSMHRPQIIEAVRGKTGCDVGLQVFPGDPQPGPDLGRDVVRFGGGHLDRIVRPSILN